jgi:hypothetical protein
LFSKNAAQIDYICAAVLSFTMTLNCRCKNEGRIELMSNVFIPELRVFGDEHSHHLRSAIFAAVPTHEIGGGGKDAAFAHDHVF